MGSIFSQLIRRENNSAKKAKERLKDVLIRDRTSLSPGDLDLLKDDLIKTISKHVDIEVNSFRINMAHDGRIHRLIADVPIRASYQRRSG